MFPSGVVPLSQQGHMVDGGPFADRVHVASSSRNDLPLAVGPTAAERCAQRSVVVRKIEHVLR